MALSTDQLKHLSHLYDRWQSGDAGQRDVVQREVNAAGEGVGRAFAQMVAHADTEASATLLPPISQSMREAAVRAAGPATAGNTDGARDAPSSPFGATLSGELPTREPGQHIGPYRLIKELGRGGMGVVWLAERADGTHARQVALKMPLVENLNWLLAARFARERNILASLEHPSIARLYDAGVDEHTQPYIAIEYVAGLPITQHVREKKLKPEAIVQLFTKVIEAVAHAHTQLVIHRDIKPSNILVDAKGDPHLLDFGIAKLLDADDESVSADATQLTRLSGRALTLDYASPEQVNNVTLGTASDVYSLGIVLYELLTGSRPYHPKGPTRRDLELAILEQEPGKPSELLLRTGDSEAGKSARSVRGDLDTIVLKALKKDPKQRYATAQAFADDLKRYIAFEPVTAKPDSEWYRISRFTRRHRVGVGVSVALGTAIAAGVAATVWQAEIARNESEKARVEAKRAEVVSTFVTDVFLTTDMYQNDPITAQKVTALELLRRGADVAEQRLRDDPKALSSVLQTFQVLLENVGDYDRALKNARTNFSLRMDGNFTSGQKVDGGIGLASILTTLNKYSEVGELFAKLAPLETAAAKEDPSQMGAYYLLLGRYLRWKRDARALPTLERAEHLTRMDALRDGASEDDIAKWMMTSGLLGITYAEHGDAERGIRLMQGVMEQAPAKRESLWGISGRLMSETGQALSLAGRYVAAEQAITQGQNIYRAHGFAEHPNIAVMDSFRLEGFARMGRWKELSELSDRELARDQKQDPNGRVLLLASLNDATHRFWLGDATDACARGRKALAARWSEPNAVLNELRRRVWTVISACAQATTSNGEGSVVAALLAEAEASPPLDAVSAAGSAVSIDYQQRIARANVSIAQANSSVATDDLRAIVKSGPPNGLHRIRSNWLDVLTAFCAASEITADKELCLSQVESSLRLMSADSEMSQWHPQRGRLLYWQAAILRDKGEFQRAITVANEALKLQLQYEFLTSLNTARTRALLQHINTPKRLNEPVASKPRQ